MERRLLEKADLCFATAHSLADNARRHNPHTFVALHGVDHQHFARALDEATVIPEDVAHLPHPVIGFFGIIHEWIDQKLVAAVARRHPEWSIVLIGLPRVDVAELRALPNVHLLGRKPYDTLPSYCKAFDVGIIPFAINELTRHVNPIKLREYLSAGLPVVSTSLPEVSHYRHLCHVATDETEFITMLEQALREDSPARRHQRSDAMRHETWEAKVAQLSAEVMRVKAAKPA
jgi:glycosyltransferase involved in cell wall biosynthesis